MCLIGTFAFLIIFFKCEHCTFPLLFFLKVLIFSCYSKIWERNTNEKSPKNHISLCAKMSDTFWTFITSCPFHREKRIWQTTPSYLCQCLELDTHCYYVSENANTSRNARENQKKWMQNFEDLRASCCVCQVVSAGILIPGNYQEPYIYGF